VTREPADQVTTQPAAATEGRFDATEEPTDEPRPARRPSPSSGSRRRPRPEKTRRAALDADTAAALREERRFLLASLRDLEREHEAGDIDDDDYESLKEDYTSRAAAVLHQLEPGGGRAAKPRADRPSRRSGAGAGNDAPPSRPARRRRIVATVTVILVVAGLAGGAVATLAGERSPSTGGATGGATAQGPAAQLTKAHTLESQGKATDALKLYDAVLRAQPANVEALTYKGWLLARAGLLDQGLTSLDQAVAADPRYPDAHFFRGMVLYEGRHDPVAAVPELEAFLANNPPPNAVPAVQDVLNRAKADAAKAKPPGG
jgi:tetratricopeptide (TPR) repeat protein